MQQDGSRSPLVLAGAGHAHLVAIRRWVHEGWRAPPGTLLISPTEQAWYSGMMPGLLAGRFREADCAIDLLPLCEAAGITLVTGTVGSLSARDSTLSTDTRELAFDVLSINTGSSPPGPPVTDGTVPQIPAKPFPAFAAAWRQWRERGAPRRITILGGGPAAFEIALALRASLPGVSLQLLSGDHLLTGHPRRLAERARVLLRTRGIGLLTGHRIDRIREGELCSGGTAVTGADALVLASGAAPLDWYEGSGLTTDRGFLRANDTLLVEGHGRIFAAGDSINLPGALRSGVYAVRQGATLAHNIPALLEGRPLRAYQPQSRALALLATADGGALMSYGNWTAQGRLPGIWKDHLDIGFMKRHRL